MIASLDQQKIAVVRTNDLTDLQFGKSGHDDRYDRLPSVILLVDVDCFEVQVWQKIRAAKNVSNDAFSDGPCLTANKAGMITSVNYAAKNKGVSRKGMTLKVAKQKCPDLEVIEIPDRFGKPDGRMPRLESYVIADKLDEFFKSAMKKKCIVQQDSKDEFFIDVTEEVGHRLTLNNGTPSMKDLSDLQNRTHLLHHNRRIKKSEKSFTFRILKVLAPSHRPDHRLELALIHGAIIADNLIKFLKMETGYQCSAGVGHNPLTAKLACGLGKPAGIAIMPTSAIERSSKSISIKDIPKLGGLKGQIIMNKFGIKTMFELSLIPNCELLRIEEVGAQALLFRSLARGEDSTRVCEKKMSQEMTCGKSFKGRRRISQKSDVFNHLNSLCSEMHERLEEEWLRNSREPTAFRIEIKVRMNKYRRNSKIRTILGEAFYNESSRIEQSKLFEAFKSKIDESDEFTDENVLNIVQINVLAKFSKLEHEDVM